MENAMTISLTAWLTFDQRSYNVNILRSITLSTPPPFIDASLEALLLDSLPDDSYLELLYIGAIILLLD